MKIIIKTFDELTSNELYQILRLRSKVFVVEQECIYLDCDDNDRRASHLFVEDGGSIAGYLRIMDKGIVFDAMSIGRVVVRKEYRKNGIAKHMVRVAIKYITQYLHETIIKISAQQYLIEFYEDMGFAVVSPGYLEDGIPHIDMKYIHNL
ncbi:MAG: GNAT family N-acetyltransferase [Anaerovoracaceae bacterium]